MCMNGDQNGRARKMVAEIQAWVAPALPGALWAGVKPTDPDAKARPVAFVEPHAVSRLNGVRVVRDPLQ